MRTKVTTASEAVSIGNMLRSNPMGRLSGRDLAKSDDLGYAGTSGKRILEPLSHAVLARYAVWRT